MKPIFIFSLPRSGSTLLQRILSSSENITTAAEPWFLLPLIYSLKSNGIVSEYWQKDVVGAIEDFYNTFPNGKGDYKKEIREFAMNLYKKNLNRCHKYFIDKTPRYSLICDEIIKLFPDAKIIFLWRNPLAIVSSILTRWCNGKWKIMIYNIDLYKGMDNMLKSCEQSKENIISLNYEELVKDTEQVLKTVCDFLDIDFNSNMITNFYNKPLKGRMVEKSGSKQYGNSIGTDSLNNWKKAFNTPLRRWWAKRYLNWIGSDKLRMIGYSHHELYKKIGSEKSFNFVKMMTDIAYWILTMSRIILSPILVHSKTTPLLFFK